MEATEKPPFFRGVQETPLLPSGWVMQGNTPSLLAATLLSSRLIQAMNQVTWSRKMAARDTEVPTQKDSRPGIRVMAPTPKAKMSVRLVTVMETPACCSARPIFSVMEVEGSRRRLVQHCTITNMSSIPIPRQRKGSMECMGV